MQPVQEPLSQRQQRAAALIAAAAVVIVLAATIYLRSSTGSAPRSFGPSAPDRSIVSSAPLIYDFATPLLGWAVESPSGPTAAIAVFKTTDGAKHWVEQLVQRTSSPEPVEVQIQFVDQLHGFVVAGGPFGLLYRTSDGGRTWASAPLPPNARNFDGVMFIDPMNGWLLGRNDQRPQLYSTGDAGDNWRQRSTPGDVSGLGVRDSSEAWLGSVTPGVPHLYLSTDAGDTWQRRDLPPPPGISWDVGGSNGQPFINTSVHVVPGVGEVASVDTGIFGAVYNFRSFDRGATWTSTPIPPGLVAYQDSIHWWAMQGTSLFKTADAGQTWTESTNELPVWHFVPEIIDSNHAWSQIVVEGGYGLAATADSGLHWTRDHVPVVD